VVPLPQGAFWNLEGKGMQQLYWHGSVSLAVEPLECVMTCPGMPDLDEGPPVDDPNRLLRCRMIRWTSQCPHCRNRRSPDRSCHPDSLMEWGILGISSMMHEGR